MALFDRNDRNFGYRGGETGRGFVDRAGDSLRRGWDRVEDAFEGRDHGPGFALALHDHAAGRAHNR